MVECLRSSRRSSSSSSTCSGNVLSGYRHHTVFGGNDSGSYSYMELKPVQLPNRSSSSPKLFPHATNDLSGVIFYIYILLEIKQVESLCGQKVRQANCIVILDYKWYGTIIYLNAVSISLDYDLINTQEEILFWNPYLKIVDINDCNPGYVVTISLILRTVPSCFFVKLLKKTNITLLEKLEPELD
uniref:Uncharacterized protein n=1 Tax=Glossina palpalis gambiensis TaxID=67801 RepID=A0A1B0BC73_9MUSC